MSQEIFAILLIFFNFLYLGRGKRTLLDYMRLYLCTFISSKKLERERKVA